MEWRGHTKPSMSDKSFERGAKSYDELEKQKDNAYWERNQLVSALSKLFPAHLAKHEPEDKDWDDDWRTIVVIKLPLDVCAEPFIRGSEIVHSDALPRNLVGGGNELHSKYEEHPYYQLSWHIHDSDIPLFDHLTYGDFKWDYHTTEDKYRRLRRIKPQTT